MYSQDGHSVSGFCSSQLKTMFTTEVLFMDESCFTRIGITSICNEHVWLHENIHAIQSHNCNDSYPSTCGLPFLVIVSYAVIFSSMIAWFFYLNMWKCNIGSRVLQYTSSHMATVVKLSSMLNWLWKWSFSFLACALI